MKLSGLVYGTCAVDDVAIIGISNGNPGNSTHGIVAPQDENWLINNARFYNFQNGPAALGDCSECGSDDYADSGCRETNTSNLFFDDSTVDRRVGFKFTNKGIFHDLDGTLT